MESDAQVAAKPPADGPAPTAIPRADKVVWFVAAPLVWLVVVFLLDAAYEQPLSTLADIWLVTAIGTWLLRRRYTGWAAKWRWIVVGAWVLIAVSRIGAQAS